MSRAEALSWAAVLAATIQAAAAITAEIARESREAATAAEQTTERAEQ